MKTPLNQALLLYVSTLHSKHKQQPLLYISDKENGRKAYFAFELEAVSITGNKNYRKWTTDILQILNRANRQVTLYKIISKIEDKDKVHVYFLFEIDAEDNEKLKGFFNDLIFHFKLLFINQSHYQPAQQPVYFRSIVDEENIKKILKLIDFNHYKAACHIHRPVKNIKDDTDIKGFAGKIDEKGQYSIPAFTLPSHKNFDLLYHLMDQSGKNTVLQVIRKKSLTPAQTGLLKRLKMYQELRNPFLKPYYVAVNSLFENKNDLFEINTYFLSGIKNQINILNEISEIYFQDQAVFNPVSNFVDAPNGDFTDYYDYAMAESVFLIPRISRENTYAAYRLLLKGEMHISPLFFNDSGVLIGRHLFGKVYLDEKQFKKHTYITGKTGTGKTSIIYSMLMDRIKKGKGVALIDPHGDLYQIVLKSIPPERQNDVIIFNPSSDDNTFGFSILKYDKNFPEQQSFIVDELLKIFSDIYDMKIAGGPMFETYFKMAAYLVMNTVENPILQDIDKVFRDKYFRDGLLRKCTTQRITDFFGNALRTTGEHHFENFGPYVTSKLTRFTDNYYLSPVFNNRTKSFDFRKMIDSNKIFLIRLDKGKLGSDSVNFTGAILFNRIIMAAYSRSNQKESERKDFSLFVDEFQNFESSDIVTALAETRKYNLQLILANQNFAQIKEKTVRNILSNVGSIISATIAPYDAKFLEDFYLPSYRANDLILLDNYKFIVKTYYNNKNIKPFILETIPY